MNSKRAPVSLGCSYVGDKHPEPLSDVVGAVLKLRDYFKKLMRGGKTMSKSMENL